MTQARPTNPWPGLWALIIGFFMLLVDTTIVSVANPAIKAALDPATTNLDTVVWTREQPELMASITQPVENMPVFDFDRGQTEALIAFLLSTARPDASEEAYRVQFARDASRAPSTFEGKCGGCHRLLTSLGPRGFGRRGPNLSGLFTPFYPKTAPGERAWSEKLLTGWIANPRALRPETVMPPAPLSETELQQVLESLRDSGAPLR